MELIFDFKLEITKMKHVLFFLVGSLLTTTVFAQSLNYSWSSSFGGSGQEMSNALVSSEDGNLYDAGTFQGTVNFNPSGSSVMASSQGGRNGYITKRSNNGIYSWSLFFLGTNNINVSDVHIDANNDLYVVGSYEQNMSISNGTNLANLPTTLTETGFIVKLTSDGQVIWSYALESNYLSAITSITTKQNNDFVIAGKFADSTQFDPITESQILESNTSLSNTLTDAFFATYSPNGNLIQVTKLGEQYAELVSDVAVDASDNIILTGSYRGSFDSDPSSQNTSLPYSNMDGIFLIKYDNQNNLVFAGGYTQDSGSDHIPRKVLADKEGNVFICGDIAENVDLDFGPQTYSVTGYSGRYVFYAKYSPMGDFLWGNSFGNSSTQTGNAMALDESGQLYLAGSFFGNMSIDDHFGNNSPTLINAGNSDIFMVRYKQDGSLLWTESFGGTSGDQAKALAILEDGVYMSGYFSSVCNFDPNGTAPQNASNGSFDAFIVKYSGSCSNQLLTIGVTDVSLCSGEFTTISASGMEIITLSNGIENGIAFQPSISTTYYILGTDTTGAGCTIEQQVSITVNSVDNTVSVNETTLTANQTNASYQWLDCNNSMSSIIGETLQSYTPNTTGNYAVVVTSNSSGCSDTSDCFIIDLSGIVEHSVNDVIVFPNPTSNNIVTVTAHNKEIQKIIIQNMLGETMIEIQEQHVVHEIDLSNLDGNQFVFLVYSEESVSMKRVTKI